MNQIDDINILIVDDRPENLFVLENLLENMNCNIIKATSGNEALSLMLDYDFALVLLDVQMPDMDGFETAELMRSSGRTRYIPVIFVTAISNEQKCIFKGYEVGAVDYLFKPIEPVILQSKVRVFIELHSQKKLVEEQSRLLQLKIQELIELRADNFRLENLSICDGLTGISNRRHFDQYLEIAWKNSIRSGKPISLVMADIDYFKAYNDNYGHLKGDESLIKVAKTMASSVKRPLDMVARYGGEEFAVILPETDMNGATIVAEDIRKNIEALAITHNYSNITPYITLSLGVATMIPSHFNSMEEFVDNADKALYKAKSHGRNIVVS
ncbi:diguanylate cyclase domain-containing protein [Clostridium sp. CF012]|uniref:diguanylate cyclase domain-containing protein n=1 Tax=Clostridium sp. CF012 TaxID=2843319 RepID=UPI001C0AA688|nr:diguanylate cyclase [Clostridium sp. CF012]MBU3144588.1 diguanylate cyclase [Clostridium sp. CF012]